MRNAIKHMSLPRAQWLAAAVLALALVLGGVASPASAQGPDDTARTIQVTGFGSASGSPDVALVQLGVQLFASDLGQAVTDANDTMEAVIAALEAEGVASEDIRTTNFSIYQESGFPPPMPMDGEAQTEVQNRYVVNNVVEVRVRDLDRISDVMQAALDAGANNVYGLNFGLDDSASLEAEARTLAVEDARERAQALADAFGLAVGDPISIREGGDDVFGPRAAFDLGAGGGGPVISEGQLSVNMQVTVTFELVGTDAAPAS